MKGTNCKNAFADLEQHEELGRNGYSDSDINNVFTSSEENVNVHPHAKLTSTIGKVVAKTLLVVAR